ncbi:hypothetical protein [Nocardia arthritidis]|uniref:Mammalian cell entry protein n=1 Tax=Nocardia arthritidis TaxID=228602 RepID=A0A6G9YSY1_9NOCA|nr:hypothetical protein [Nocardia arthritidis]QIS15993.1 hypothetical protein F5544_40895 [Nocardia arthritidis]
MSIDITKESDSQPRQTSADERPAGLAKSTNEQVGTGKARTIAFVVSSTALVVALAAAAWFGVGWVRAAYFTDGPRAQAREAALDGARQAALNMTTTNLDDVPGSSALQRSSMTGALLDSATKNQQQIEAMMTSAGVQVNSKVVGSSLTELDSELDRASAIVVLRVTETKKDHSQPPDNYRYTWSLNMAKVGDVWKAEQVASLEQPVELGSDTQAPANPAAPQTPAPPAQPTPKPGS